jgi:hypothetical protein
MIKGLSTFLEVLAQHWWLCSRKLRRDEQVAYTRRCCDLNVVEGEFYSRRRQKFTFLLWY